MSSSISFFTLVCILTVSYIETGTLLLTNIHYAKFPIVKLNLSKKNSFSILGIVIFFIILLYGILNKEYHIVLLFFISLYIVSGIILSIVKKLESSIAILSLGYNVKKYSSLSKIPENNII